MEQNNIRTWTVKFRSSHDQSRTRATTAIHSNQIRNN
uniref:Uncharacterized protein n=1 Tax=Rhizophora mucronata TaxID=61149 RepID=A0A2P2P9N9_RHIMU